MSYAFIMVGGNIGQDAVVREVNGRFVINFSLANNHKWTDKDGIRQESTTWYSCSMWKESRDKTKIAEYLRAGQIVTVQGTPEIKTYPNKDGKTVAALNVNVSWVDFGGSAKREETTAKPHVVANTTPPEYIPEEAWGGNDKDVAF